MITLDDWPDCSSQDCMHKVCLSLNSDLCYPCTLREAVRDWLRLRESGTWMQLQAAAERLHELVR